VNIKTSLLHKICSFYTNFVKFFLYENIHEFCMVYLPYHNENVKIFSMQIFTVVMGNRDDKGTLLF